VTDVVGTRARGCYGPTSMAAKTTFSSKELEDLREALLKEQAELKAQLAELEESTFSTPQSDISGEVAFDEEYADSGTATFERERDLSLENNIRDLLEKIEKALERMENGTYGICGRCGKPIEKARLKALPYANLCIKDKQAESRR
jgi:RNA polymerase-binding transcription factor